MTKEELITEYATKFRRALVLFLGIENFVNKEKEIETFGNTIKEYLGSFYNKIKKPEQQYGRWKPKIGDICWFISDSCKILSLYWYDCQLDKIRYSIGNIYQTKEQAEQALERMKIRTQLEDIALRLNKGQKIDWNDVRQEKYYLLYDIEEHILAQDYRTISQTDDVYCLEPFLRVAIKEIGEERLAKYLKGE